MTQIESLTATTKPSRPQITSTDNFHVYDGDDLHLTCSVDIEKGTKASLLWELPSNDRAIKVRSLFLFALDKLLLIYHTISRKVALRSETLPPQRTRKTKSRSPPCCECKVL